MLDIPLVQHSISLSAKITTFMTTDYQVHMKQRLS